MNFKIFIICLTINTPEDDHSEEILRVIIYDFVSTNLFILIKLESSFFIHIFYYSVNLYGIIMADADHLSSKLTSLLRLAAKHIF